MPSMGTASTRSFSTRTRTTEKRREGGPVVPALPTV